MRPDFGMCRTVVAFTLTDSMQRLEEELPGTPADAVTSLVVPLRTRRSGSEDNTMRIARRGIVTAIQAVALIGIATGIGGATMFEADTEKVRNVVLVHGAFADGSGWRSVYDQLKKAGHRVTIVQIATHSLADDVRATKRALAEQDGPAILVGHSYGGVVITEAGTDPKVAGLVYVAAFAPDKGESVSALTQNAPPGAEAPPILPPQDGQLFIDRAKFRAAFAADVDAATAEFMSNSQAGWGLEALGGAISEPAWKSKPSWYVVATEDHMIPPDAQRGMSKRAGSTVIEVKASHAVYVSQPRAVADLIMKAASGVAVASR